MERIVQDAATGGQTPPENRPLPDRDIREDDRALDPRALADLRAAENALARFEAANRHEREDAGAGVKRPAARGEGPSALERFKRSAEKIARSAEIGKRPFVADKADGFAAFPEKGRPEIGCELFLAARNAAEKARRQEADPGVEQRLWRVDPEGRDAVPFGLKRRVSPRLPVFDDGERGRPAAGAVRPQKTREIGLDRGIAVDDEEISVLEKGGSVSKGSGSSENLRLLEEDELRHVRRAFGQVLLDLAAEVMEVDSGFRHAGVFQPLEVSAGERDIQEGQEGFGDALRHRPEPQSSPGGQEKGLHASRSRKA